MATDSTQQMQDLQEMLTRMRELGDSSYRNRMAQEASTDALMKTKLGLNNFSASTKSGADAVAAMAKSATSYISAMYNGQRGYAAMNESLTNLGTAAKAAGVALMLLGGPVTMVIGALTVLTGVMIDAAKKVGEFNDAQFKTYQELSQSGANAADGMDGVTMSFVNLGYSLQEMNQIVGLINSNAEDLALFGRSVSDGRKKFVELSDQFAPFKNQLYMMGYTTEQIDAAVMSFVKNQTRIGGLQGKVNQEMAESARKYIMEQDALTKLTGMNRREQEQAIEQVRSQERFAASMQDLRNKGREEEAKQIEMVYKVLYSQNKEAAQGFADAQAGMYGFTEASIKSMNATQGSQLEIVQQLQTGKIKAAEALDLEIKARKRTFDELGTTFGRLGIYNSFVGDYAGDQRLIALGSEGIAKKLTEINKELDDEGKKNSEQTRKRVALEAGQRENTRKLLGAMNQVAPGVTDLLMEFADYLNIAVDALANFVDFMVDSFTSDKPIETQAAVEYRKRAFQSATFTQDALKINQTEEQKKADEVLRKGLRLENMQRAAKDKEMFAKDPKDFKTIYGVETPDLAMEEEKKLKAELAAIVKEMGLEDVRAKKEERKKMREENRRRSDEQRKRTQELRQGASTAPASALPPAGAKPVTEADLKARGLKFDSAGDVQRSDMALSPKLIDLAEKVQKQVDGFQKFNGFNDRFHHTDPQYYGDHTRGQAFDFALNYNPTREQGQKIVSQLKSMGFYHARDEYNDPSGGATGGHIHAAIKEFADGGILRARPGGEVVRAAENGYDEAFIPLKNGTVPVTINGLDIDREISAAMTRAFDNQNTVYVDAMKSMVNDLRQTMTDAVSRMNNNNEVFGQLLASTQEMVRNQQQTNSLQTKMLQAVSS
jgi:hypothetical protein